MKTFTATLKLVFAAMLVCLVFAVRPARAYQVGQYDCVSGYQTCYVQAQEFMAQCMADCTEFGGQQDVEVCYETVTTVTFVDNEQVVDTFETCPTMVSSAEYTCATACVQDYENDIGECLESYCTYAG